VKLDGIGDARRTLDLDMKLVASVRGKYVVTFDGTDVPHFVMQAAVVGHDPVHGMPLDRQSLADEREPKMASLWDADSSQSRAVHDWKKTDTAYPAT
jgi:hypothetical protein